MRQHLLEEKGEEKEGKLQGVYQEVRGETYEFFLEPQLQLLILLLIVFLISLVMLFIVL